MKTIIFFLLFNICYCQNSIVTAGNKNETFGENITRIQTFDTIIETSLNVPKFEVTIEQLTKPVSKKKSLFEKIVDFIKKLFNT